MYRRVRTAVRLAAVKKLLLTAVVNAPRSRASYKNYHYNHLYFVHHPFLYHSMRPTTANLCCSPVTSAVIWSHFSSTIVNLLIPSIVYHLVISSSCNFCVAFNFEPKLPVIKRGVTGSYFGYSVAEHIIGDARIHESV